MPTYGVTPAGFSIKPLAAILSDLEDDQLATMDAAIDLSPTGPQGQLNGIVANAMTELWELAAVCFNANNREAVEGAGLDSIGDLVGIPRELEDSTQVLCTLTFTGTTTYAPGSLVAAVAGNPSLTFTNVSSVTGAPSVVGVLFQASLPGPTPTINPGTLTVIVSANAGWNTITNPAAQVQLGDNAELDALYAARQEQELALEGSCNAAATVAALVQLAASQDPPVNLTATAYENTTYLPLTLPGSDVVLPPHTYALFLYDQTQPTPFTTTAEQAIGQIIWTNKPAGIQSTANLLMAGAVAVTIDDPYLGPQVVYYWVPIPVPLYVSVQVVLRPGFTLAQVSATIQAALVAAAVAPTPANGSPPNGQLAPGADVIGAQLQAVVMGCAGVYDVQFLKFGAAPAPTNTAPLPITALQVATIAAATAATNILVTQGTFP